MARKIGEAYVSVKPEVDKNFSGDLEKNATPAAKGAGEKSGNAFTDAFGTTLKRLATTAAATFAGFEVVDFFKESIAAAREAEQAQRLTAAAITSTGGAAHVSAGDVEELSLRLSNISGVHKDVIQSGADVGLTFTQIANRAGAGNDIFNQYVQSALDVSAGLHQNLQPSIIQIGKALNDPITGMTTLRRIGISFTADQIKQAQELTKTGHLMEAQKLILGELNKEFGGAAAAASDPAEKATNSWHNFQEELGKRMLPVVDQLLAGLTRFLPTLESVAGRIVDTVVAVGNFLSRNKELLLVLVSTAVALGALGTAIEAVKAVHEAWLVVTLAESAALDASSIGVIILAIAALVAGVIYAYTHFKVFRDTVNAVWDFLKGVGAWLAGPFVNFFVTVFDWIKTHWVLLLSILTGPIGAAVIQIVVHWRAIRDAIVGAWDSIVSAVETAVAAVVNAVVGAFQAVVAFITAAVHFIVDPLVAAWNAVEAVTVAVFTRIGAFFAKWWPLLLLIFAFPIALLLAAWNHFHTQIIAVVETTWNLVRAYLTGAWTVIRVTADAVWDAIRVSAIAVWDAIRVAVQAVWTALQVAAAAVWEAIRVAIIGPVEWLWARIVQVWDAVYALLVADWNAVVAVARVVWEGIRIAIINPIEAAWNFLSGIAGRIRDAVVGAFDTALHAVEHIGDQFASIGEGIVMGIVHGIEGAGHFLLDKLKNLANDALSAAKSFLGIGSPSKLFADEVGKWIPAGIQMGIDNYGAVTVPAPGFPGAPGAPGFPGTPGFPGGPGSGATTTGAPGGVNQTFNVFQADKSTTQLAHELDWLSRGRG